MIPFLPFLNNLTPAPWGWYLPGDLGLTQYGAADGVRVYGPEHSQWVADVGGGPSDPERTANAEFIALARNAFDVMMRRPWYTDISLWDGDLKAWQVREADSKNLVIPNSFADPFTALVEADKWYKANVEKVQP